MPRLPHSQPAWSRLSAVAIAGLLLSACAPDRAITGSTYPRDYRERHPIVLTDMPRTLDVFVTGSGGLDRRQHDDVKAFAAEYRRHGRGVMVAQLPSGTGMEAAAHTMLAAIRAAMVEGGLPGAYMSVSTYPAADPRSASAVRLSFQRMQAKVGSKCGLWPQDLGASDFKFDVNNEPYWNLGCATQANVAAQVADPVDLVRGRTEGRLDTLKRTKNIDDLRQGKDPSTQYRQDGQTSVKQQVAQ